MIDPAGIPLISGDMAALTQHAAALSQVGTAFADTGGRVHGTWQSLASCYRAPEAEQLFAATAPIPGITASVGADLRSVGSALSSYAAEVTGIQARLRVLHGQALEFVAFAAASPDWLSNAADVDRHNALLAAVNAAVADFQDAERRCANRILALYTDRRYAVDNGDGVLEGDEYGFSRETLGALGEAGALPWGRGERHDRGFWGDVGAFWGGFGEGAWEAVTGVGALFGLSGTGFSWETAGTAWSGLGLFALAVFPPTGLINAHTDLFGIPRGKLGEVLTAAGEGLVAYDLWGVDNSRAAGKTVFNILSAIVGTKGAGAALRTTGAAAAASRIGLVANVGGGVLRVAEGVGRLPSVSAVAGDVLARFRGLEIPPVDLPRVDLPPTHIDPPRIEPPPLPPVGSSVADALPPARSDGGDGTAIAGQDPPLRPDDGVGALSSPQDPPPVRPDEGIGTATAAADAPPGRAPEPPAADAPPAREPVREPVLAGSAAPEAPAPRPAGTEPGFGNNAGRYDIAPEGRAPDGPTANNDRSTGEGPTPGADRPLDTGPVGNGPDTTTPTGDPPTPAGPRGEGAVGDAGPAQDGARVLPDADHGGSGPDGTQGADSDSPGSRPDEGPSGNEPGGPDADQPRDREDEPDPTIAQREALEQAGLDPDYVHGVPPEQLGRVQEALDQWNVDGEGKNQGATHVIDYAHGAGGPDKMNRLERLTDTTGAGPFSPTDPLVIPKVNEALDAAVNAARAHPEIQVRVDGEKTTYFVPLNNAEPGPNGFSNSQRGMAIITYEGKYATFYNTRYKSFKG